MRAGLDGMLQLVPVEVGQQVAPGTNLARVANPEPPEGGNQDRGNAGQGHPDRPEGRDRHPQRHRRGRVARIDPSVQNGTRTVDVSLNGDLPRGAVPDLSVDGTIEPRRLDDVLFMGRPAFGQDQSSGRRCSRLTRTAWTPSASR